MKVLLFSDIHYTVEKSPEELKKEFPMSEASIASGAIFGFTQEEKINRAKADIIAENSKSKIDAVFMLGDLSIDDYNYRKLPLNFCRELKNRLFNELPCPVYAIPGNHDSYPNTVWKEIFGYERQYYVEIGEYIFIMADTFAGYPAVDGAGSKFTSLDIEFINKVIREHPNSKFFICSHYVKDESDNDEFSKIMKDNRVICLFRGHTHIHENIKMSCGKYIIDIGGYGYNGIKTEYGYEFNIFDEKWAWSYTILDITDKDIIVSHMTPERIYCAKNGCFLVKEKIERKNLGEEAMDNINR